MNGSKMRAPIRYSGMIVTSSGTKAVNNSSANRAFLPRNSIRAKANPASEEVISWPSPDIDATKKLLKV